MSVPVLELKGLVKVYGAGEAAVRVLHGLDLRIEEGEYVAIAGPSGSGKSTLLNILGCLDRSTEGEYRIAGENVSQLDDKRLSNIRNTRIGFIFQSFQLVTHLTVLENVELPLFYARMARTARRERARELLERVGLSHRLGHVPTMLSGGERQRVAVARALANEPALILADEPTGNLDSATSREIMDMLYELHAAGRTIVLITHDPEIASAAPRRVFLRDGAIESDEGDGHDAARSLQLTGGLAPAVGAAPAGETVR